MRGLLIKDIQLLLQQRIFLGAVFVLSAVISFTAAEGPEFVCGYVTMLFALQAVGTLSYDEMDNSFLYLFSLPITRKIYVLEKYVFCTMISVFACIFSAVLILVTNSNIVEIGEITVIAGCIFAASMIMISVVLPVNMKFGAEKGRLAIFAFAAIIIILAMGFGRIQEIFSVDINEIMTKVSLQAVAVTSVVILIMIYMVSFLVSTKIMEKKQF